jgi:hypothetical protein
MLFTKLKRIAADAPARIGLSQSSFFGVTITGVLYQSFKKPLELRMRGLGP